MITGLTRFGHIKKEKVVDDAGREKEKFEYLFLDIEWNQAPGTTGLDGREAIQIGVVAADEKLQKIKTFSKADVYKRQGFPVYIRLGSISRIPGSVR